jgi:hypothetical protein
MEKPTTAYKPSFSRSTSSERSSATCPRTLSEYVTGGKSLPAYGAGVFDGEDDCRSYQGSRQKCARATAYVGSPEKPDAHDKVLRRVERLAVPNQRITTLSQLHPTHHPPPPERGYHPEHAPARRSRC